MGLFALAVSLTFDVCSAKGGDVDTFTIHGDVAALEPDFQLVTNFYCDDLKT